MNILRKILSSLALASIVLANTSQAGMITFDSVDSVVNTGETFQLTLVGRDWTDGQGGTYGGGVSVEWDSSILSLLSYDTSVFSGDQFLASSGVTTSIDNTSGKLNNLAVNSLFNGVYQADFDIAVLTFSALSMGSTSLIATLGIFDNGSDNIWTDTGDGVNAFHVSPNFMSAQVSAVPIPSSIYLLGGALLFFSRIARRKKALNKY